MGWDPSTRLSPVTNYRGAGRPIPPRCSVNSARGPIERLISPYQKHDGALNISRPIRFRGITRSEMTITDGGHTYSLMVLPSDDRWLWFVTVTSATSTDSAQWGRMLGCSDAPDEAEAWKRAKRVVKDFQASGRRQLRPVAPRSEYLAVNVLKG